MLCNSAADSLQHHLCQCMPPAVPSVLTSSTRAAVLMNRWWPLLDEWHTMHPCQLQFLQRLCTSHKWQTSRVATLLTCTPQVNSRLTDIAAALPQGQHNAADSAAVSAQNSELPSRSTSAASRWSSFGEKAERSMSAFFDKLWHPHTGGQLTSRAHSQGGCVCSTQQPGAALCHLQVPVAPQGLSGRARFQDGCAWAGSNSACNTGLLRLPGWQNNVLRLWKPLPCTSTLQRVVAATCVKEVMQA